MPLVHMSPIGQTSPQVPQLFSSRARSKHAPPQQLWPAGHGSPQAVQFASETGMHALAQHSWSAPHAVPHAPQLLASFGVQVPPQQSSSDAHAFPHVPQLAGSLDMSTQEPAQHVMPIDAQSSVQAMHVIDAGSAHVPPQQLSPAVQALPHMPQFSMLTRVSAHVPPQHVRPSPHTLPHVPQFASSPVVSAQAPSQHSWSPHPAPHSPQCVWLDSSSTHAPPQQVSPSPHARPQVPQFTSSVLRSKPLSTAPSQSLSRPSHTSIIGVGAMHASASSMHPRVPFRQAPSWPSTVQGSPAPTTSSTAPSQSSSSPLQVSLSGRTSPSQAPNCPVASQVCMPITH
jgi:hypothetical protein